MYLVTTKFNTRKFRLIHKPVQKIGLRTLIVLNLESQTCTISNPELNKEMKKALTGLVLLNQSVSSAYGGINILGMVVASQMLNILLLTWLTIKYFRYILSKNFTYKQIVH